MLNQNKSGSIALGGMFSALCIALMFMSGILPWSQIIIPIAAGSLLLVVVHEMGRKMALVAYIAVSLLSLFLAVPRSTALFFIIFTGYYPIIKGVIERIQSKHVVLAIKLVILNVAMIAQYFVFVYVFGMPGLLFLEGTIGTYGALAVSVVFSSLYFIMIDRELTKMEYKYVNRWRYRLLRR